MRAELILCNNVAAAASETALRVARHFEACPGALVALAAGFTPLEAYAKLARMAEDGEVSPAAMRYVGLDEWVGLGPADAGSCIFTMNKAFYGPCGIPERRIRVFDGLAKDPEAEAREMEAHIEASGGLSLAVLGIGVNGHVGFNEPGQTLPGLFSLTALSETTTQIGRKYFGDRAVPTRGATITLNALMSAREVILIATGAHKRAVVRAVLAGDDLPAAKFLEHPNAAYIFDEEAYPGARAVECAKRFPPARG